MTFFIPRREEFWQRPPTGPIELNENHDLADGLLRYQILTSEYYINSGINAPNTPFPSLNLANGDWTGPDADYLSNYHPGEDELGEFLDASTQNTGASIVATKSLTDHGWGSIADNQAHTILASGPLNSLNNFVFVQTSQFQLYSVALSATSQTIRCINRAKWSAGVDLSFTEPLAVGKELFLGFAFDGASDTRSCYFGDSVGEHTNFTGVVSAADQIDLFAGYAVGQNISARWFGVWDKYIGPEAAAEHKENPYAIVKPRSQLFAVPSGGAGSAPIMASALRGA